MATRAKPSAKTTTAPAAPPWTPSELIRILDDRYGRAPQQASAAPVFELLLTLLSQHTSDRNSGQAMHRLIERFPTWDAVLAAPVREVEDAIRPGGLAPTKSKRMQELLAEVKVRKPDWDLGFLRGMPLEDAKAWLTSLPGVGPKTAACVLLFALERPALPVDTHVERVSKRLGLVPLKMPADKAPKICVRWTIKCIHAKYECIDAHDRLCNKWNFVEGAFCACKALLRRWPL